MSTIVNDERRKLNDEYARLRLKIFDIYRELALVGAYVTMEEYDLPRKLGNWREHHSERVRAVSEHVRMVSEGLAPIVQRIEELRAWRDPARIQAHRKKQNPGLNFKRKAAPKVQINPGEWPPKFK